MDHLDLEEGELARTGFKEERVGETVCADAVLLHLGEGGEGVAEEGVLSEGSDEGVVEEGVGVWDLVEDGDGGGDLAAEREGGDEFGGDEGVLVEVGFVDLGEALFQTVGVRAFVEILELLFEHSALGDP